MFPDLNACEQLVRLSGLTWKIPAFALALDDVKLGNASFRNSIRNGSSLEAAKFLHQKL